MKRNWDTIREILLKVEECSSLDGNLQLDDFSSEKGDEISYHVRLLLDAGLLDGRYFDVMDEDPACFFIDRLTWEGHEFLDTIRSNKVWEKTKKTFVEKGIEMTFDLVRSGATQIAASFLNS